MKTAEEKRAWRRAHYFAKGKAARKARVAADPAKYLAAQRKRYYGVSREDTDALLAAQGNACAICRSAEPKGRGQWHLDHDHVTGKIRGFLCRPCNNGLGFFADSPLRLEAAAGYLRRCGTL